MTASEVLRQVLDGGGRIVADPERPRLLVPPQLRPLVEHHRAELRAALCSPEPRLTPDQCLELLSRACRTIGQGYALGAIDFMFDEAPELGQGFRDAERRIEELMVAFPSETEFRTALAEYTQPVLEASRRVRRCKVAADPMPALDGGVSAAIGFSRGDGQEGWWSVVGGEDDTHTG